MVRKAAEGLSTDRSMAQAGLLRFQNKVQIRGRGIQSPPPPIVGQVPGLAMVTEEWAETLKTSAPNPTLSAIGLPHQRPRVR